MVFFTGTHKFAMNTRKRKNMRFSQQNLKHAFFVAMFFLAGALSYSDYSQAVDHKKITDLSSADQTLLKSWGFNDNDEFWLVDNFKNPLLSTRIKAYAPELITLAKNNPNVVFAILDYKNLGDENPGQNPTEADLLLLLPYLMNIKGVTPNRVIGLKFDTKNFALESDINSLSDKDRGSWPVEKNSLIAPLIFLAIQPGYERLLTALLRYPSVDVNAEEARREATDDQRRNNLPRYMTVINALTNKVRAQQTPLQYVIREYVACRKAENKGLCQHWLQTLNLLLQRPDIKLDDTLKFYIPEGKIKEVKEKKKLIELAEGYEEVLNLLENARLLQQARAEGSSQKVTVASTNKDISAPMPALDILGQSISDSSTSGMAGKPFQLAEKYPLPGSGKPDIFYRYEIMPPPGIKMPTIPAPTISFLNRLTFSSSWLHPENLLKIVNIALVGALGYLGYTRWKSPSKNDIPEANSTVLVNHDTIEYENQTAGNDTCIADDRN
jgi:hypothetical protein